MTKNLQGFYRTLEINIDCSKTKLDKKNISYWSVSEPLFQFCRGELQKEGQRLTADAMTISTLSCHTLNSEGEEPLRVAS